MFTSSIYAKILMSGIVVAIVASLYFYVTGLQSQVKALRVENQVLFQNNQNLSNEIKDYKFQHEILLKVNQAGDIIREQNRNNRTQKIDRIDRKVTEGKDRPVGPLLLEFFNESK